MPSTQHPAYFCTGQNGFLHPQRASRAWPFLKSLHQQQYFKSIKMQASRVAERSASVLLRQRKTYRAGLFRGTANFATQAARAHRSQRTVFVGCVNNKKGPVFQLSKLPVSVSKFPAMPPPPQNEQGFYHAHMDMSDFAGHSAGDIATVYARPLPLPQEPSYAATLQENAAHLLLMGGAGGMAALAAVNGLTTNEVFFTTMMAKQMVCNVPVASMCASAGDVVAQLMTGTKAKNIDGRRVVAAGAIGGALQGFGTTGWLWNLNLAIPRSMIGFDSLQQLGMLGGKVLIDSAMWGTVINTLNVLARRIAAGDSVIQAYHTWRDKIVSITKSEFKFWPAFGSVVYTCVPEVQQVNAFGVGGFIWSVYLSYAASHGVTSNCKGLFRYGRPIGVRMTTPMHVEQPKVTGRLVPVRFEAKSNVLPLHGAVGRPRMTRGATGTGVKKLRLFGSSAC